MMIPLMTANARTKQSKSTNDGSVTIGYSIHSTCLIRNYFIISFIYLFMGTKDKKVEKI
jgi:hypothetical protein